MREPLKALYTFGNIVKDVYPNISIKHKITNPHIAEMLNNEPFQHFYSTYCISLELRAYFPLSTIQHGPNSSICGLCYASSTKLCAVEIDYNPHFIYGGKIHQSPVIEMENFTS